ncbi:hypothetical protein M407DRAFT_243910 [Tulasnella calospora MUT 4182]|uniref:Uncharacterized protein n=1 Tax=Tulasnella calospora MUT 4182 TaxID=1051891 RepID=A0A0C3KWU7_9AGAM|nr:hypothetical protein M407DRAFT_243910 [Tulasnella calospora MUT 4182]
MLRSRSLFRSVQALSTPLVTPARCIHSTTPVLKKKGKAAAKATEEDAFDDGFADDDLFGGATSNQSKGESVLPKQLQEKAQKSATNAEANAAKRVALFEAEKTELLFRLAPDRDISRPKAKKTAIRSILRWADSPAQLWMVRDLIADMRKAKIGLHEDTAKEFLGRCISLHQPDIALHVLAERPRYRLDLDLNTARDLLHSIFIRATHATPLAHKKADEWKPFTASHHQDALFVAGLYPRFGLGEATEDPVASALLMSMFATNRTTSTSDMPQVEGLGSYGDVATELGRDLLKNTRSKQLVHLSTSASYSSKKDQPPFLHRHQVWLDSELRRADVKKLLTKLGFDTQSLSSLGVSSKTIGALSSDASPSS